MIFISDKELTLETIFEIYNRNPGWLIIVLEGIFADKTKIYLRDTTLIVNLYELTPFQVNVLFEYLKCFKRKKLFTKVIDKKEFLIIHSKEEDVLKILTNNLIWKVNLIEQMLKKLKYKKIKIDEKNGFVYNKDKTLKLDGNSIIVLEENITYQFSYAYSVLMDILEHIFTFF